MQEFPHHYTVTATASALGDVELTAPRLWTLRSASPAQFDGPGDRWSPETLLTAAVGDCLILTFRAVARGSRVAWTSLECHVTGTLDRVERTPQFVRFEVHAHLRLPAGADPEAARRALEKAERHCLISNSLKAAIHLTTSIDMAMASAGELTTAALGGKYDIP
jgi:organic hydroperoxide reductase OsmC/OhrA